MAKTLTEVLIENGLEPKESGGGRKVIPCPFHKGDNEASFTIYPTETYFCFGCEKWGDAVQFLVDFKDIDYKEALEIVGLDYKTPKSEKAQVIKVKNPSRTYKFLFDVVMEYHEFLMLTPGAMNYLEKRGLSKDTIVRYRLGYSDGRVLALQSAFEMEMAVEIGLVNKGGYEMMSHRITIPNLTEEGHCDFIMGRTVTNDKVKYLGARMPKPIHGFFEVRHSPILFVVEGQLDWLTLRQWGYPAVAVSGTHMTKANEALLADKKLVIVPDLDESGVGMNAAESMQRKFGENAVILDYSELRKPNEKLDVSSLAEYPGGEYLFNTIVREQLPWITYMSKRILTKWFPALATTTPFH